MNLCLEIISTVPVPTVQKRHEQTGQGPKEGYRDIQRAGEPALLGKVEGDSSFHPEEEEAQWETHQTI